MPAEPEIKPLAYKQRTWFFRSLFIIFAVSLPMVVFYATGYRFDFTTAPNIISTGGMYVSVPVEDTEIYINEALVRDIRVFRRASYIQNLSAGMHRLHVQGPGVQTWVKELPVRAHIVTEVEAFNLPVVPQIRLITPWETSGGQGVFVGVATSTLADDFAFASVTESVLASTTLATTTLVRQEEHEFVTSLFGTSSVESTLVDTVVQNVNDTFTFSNRATTSTSSATTTVEVRDMRLYEADGELYARWVGNESDIPYYFCVYHEAASSTRAAYGEHVYDGVAAVLATMPITETQDRSSRVCREEIRIDRMGQEIGYFNFFPGNSSLVLLQLEDGLYVTEIDDRAWQNSQLLYPGDDIEVRIEGGQIYVRDRGYLLEVLTEIEPT